MWWLGLSYRKSTSDALLYNTDRCLSIYNLDVDAYNWPSSAQQVGCLCIILPLHGFNYHLLAPIASYAKLHFTLHLRTMLNVRRWILHLTLIACSTFALIQSGFHTMCSQWVSLSQSLCLCCLLTVHLEVWICSTVCYGQDEMACHLHPILHTWDAVTTCTPVTVFFPLGVQLCSLHPKMQLKGPA